EKNDPRRGMAAAWRGSGMAITFYCGSFIDRKPKNCSKRSVTSFQAARRVENRHAALVKELVTVHRAKLLDTPGAAFGILSRLDVTHINFIFLLFAHITFLSCVFGFGLCSRRIVA